MRAFSRPKLIGTRSWMGAHASGGSQLSPKSTGSAGPISFRMLDSGPSLAHPKVSEEVGRARFPLLFPEQAGPDRSLREHRGARARRSGKPGTCPTATTAEAQGNRDLGRTEPAISGQEKTARPIQNFCLRRNGQSVHLKQSCDTAPGSPTG